jgi:hypothetical protein
MTHEETQELIRLLRAQLDAAWEDNRALRADIERLSLDAHTLAEHILAEELERERAPKQDCR